MPSPQTPPSQRELPSIDISEVALNDPFLWWRSPLLRWRKPPLLYVFMNTAPPYEMKIGETGGETAARIVGQRQEYSHLHRLLLIHIRDLDCERNLRRTIECLLQRRVKSEMPWCYLHAQQISQYYSSQIDGNALRYVVDTVFDYLQACFPPQVNQHGRHYYHWLDDHATDTFFNPAGRKLGRGLHEGSRYTLLPGCRIVPLKSCSVAAAKKIRNLYETGYLMRTAQCIYWSPGLKAHRPITLSCREKARWLISGGYRRGYYVQSDEPAKIS